MANVEYRILDAFEVNGSTVLVLDRAYSFGRHNYAYIDGIKMKFALNSIRTWIIVKSESVSSLQPVIKKSISFA